MRTNHLFLIAAVCATALAGLSKSVQAQPTNASGIVAPANPAGPRPANRLYSVRSSIGALERAIGDLKRADNDFGGHRQTAIDACMKAEDELKEVAKAAGIPMPPMRGPGMQRPMGVPPPAANPPAANPPPAQPAPAPQ